MDLVWLKMLKPNAWRGRSYGTHTHGWYAYVCVFSHRSNTHIYHLSVNIYFFRFHILVKITIIIIFLCYLWSVSPLRLGTRQRHHRRCCYSLCIQFYYYYCSSFVFLHYSIARKTLFPLACDVLAVIGIYSGVFIYLFIFIYLAVSASNRNFGFCLLSSTSSVAVSIHALTHFVRKKFSLIKIMWQLSIVDFNLASYIHVY